MSKSEPRSKPATGILKDCVDRLQDTDQAASALKKAMIQVAGKNYPLYCKYQLIKYKPWIGNLVFIKEYTKFLGSDYGFEHVPKAAVEIMKARELPLPKDSDDEAPPPLQEDEEPCEEWMLLCHYVYDQADFLHSIL